MQTVTVIITFHTQDVQLEEVIIDDNNCKPPVPVNILLDAEGKEVSDPFPFPVTYGSDTDATLQVGNQLATLYICPNLHLVLLLGNFLQHLSQELQG